jgi:ABC-type multidrug transport system ATPase subunit
VLQETLNCEELFAFACKIRMGFSGDLIKARVDDVIQKLSLQACKHTIIGGWLRKGVSGGERKRISIGYELISNPSLMLLDEPTSGLDSSTSLRIVKMLRQECLRGMAVLATIHQPSSELFMLFDKVILLSDGFTVYNGPPNKVSEFFS